MLDVAWGTRGESRASTGVFGQSAGEPRRPFWERWGVPSVFSRAGPPGRGVTRTSGHDSQGGGQAGRGAGASASCTGTRADPHSPCRGSRPPGTGREPGTSRSSGHAPETAGRGSEATRVPGPPLLTPAGQVRCVNAEARAAAGTGQSVGHAVLGPPDRATPTAAQASGVERLGAARTETLGPTGRTPSSWALCRHPPGARRGASRPPGTRGDTEVGAQPGSESRPQVPPRSEQPR